MDVLISKININGVYALLLMPQTKSLSPIVIMYHGYLGQKESQLPQSYYLASHGYIVISPDACGHGDRGSGAVDFMSAVEQSANEINSIIDYCDQNRIGDISRVGLAGLSMGGCITFQYLAGNDRRIRAAVSTIGTPDWVSIFETPDALDLFSSVNLAKSKQDMERMIESAKKRQPLNRIKNLPGIPILIQYGGKDTLIPPSAVEKFFESYIKIDNGKTGSELLLYPNLGHWGYMEFNIKTVSWFQKHLG